MALPVLSGRDVIKALSKAGFNAVRQRWSHVIMVKEGAQPPIRITVPLHKAVKKGTLKAIISQSGLSTKEFLGLL
jgi:predicted RNA binding protein YcfA (HicA-like mRNA interferase family)